MCAVEANEKDGKQRQILVLGGFGGAARHIARRIDAQIRSETFNSEWWDPTWHVQRSPHQLGVLWRANRGEIGELWERAGHAVDVLAQQYTHENAWLLRADGTRRLRGVVREVLAGTPVSGLRR